MAADVPGSLSDMDRARWLLRCQRDLARAYGALGWSAADADLLAWDVTMIVMDAWIEGGTRH